MTRAWLDRRPADVAAMFDRTAERYDVINDVLSLGQDRLWRRAVADTVNAGPGEIVLDVAAGTGTSARAFVQRGARCVACDFSLGMLRVGVRRRGGASVGGVGFVAGDALALPFADASFDVTTISFGLRNVADPDIALAEMLRVAKPGGRLVVCEFSRPPVRSLDLIYSKYLMNMIPAIGRRLSANPEAYEYLAESIRAWPDQRALARKIANAGWQRVAWRNLTFGIVALHRAYKPSGRYHHGGH